MTTYRLFRRLAVLLSLAAISTANAASQRIQVYCQGDVPAEAYYYDGKQSQPLKLSNGQFTAEFSYAPQRFALFDTPPSFDASGKLQSTPFAHVELPADSPRTLVMLATRKAPGKTGASMIAVPQPAPGAAPALTVFNLCPALLGVAVDQERLKLPAYSAQTVPLDASATDRKMAKHSLKVLAQINDTWKPLAMSNLFLRTDRTSYLLLRQPTATKGANASTGEQLTWDVVYAPGS